MSSKPITTTDYRYGIGDKYGRAECSQCHRFRRINAYWKDKNRVLCHECSTAPGIAFAASVRGGSVSIKV